MNGHHADCSCQSCTIGREIGMDRALELIREMRAALVSQRTLLIGHEYFESAGVVSTHIVRADNFLAEHE